jgi:hypothetical protein
MLVIDLAIRIQSSKISSNNYRTQEKGIFGERFSILSSCMAPWCGDPHLPCSLLAALLVVTLEGVNGSQLHDGPRSPFLPERIFEVELDHRQAVVGAYRWTASLST